MTNEQQDQLQFNFNELSEAVRDLIKVIQYLVKCISPELTIDDIANPNLDARYNTVTNKWKNANNSKPCKGDVNTKPSKTIPNEALTIPEIMNRYARGLPLEGQRVPVYDEDPENPMPDLSKMDLIDQHNTVEEAKKELLDIAAKYRNEQDRKKQEAYDEYKKKYEELDKKYKEQLKPEVHLTPPNKEQ